MPIPRPNRILPLLLFGAASLLAQPSGKATAEARSPTFKAAARVVLVDVVVTDNRGQPVHNLKQRDFAVLDDGKPQGIVAFEEHRSDAASNALPALHLPENVYTNYVSRGERGALTVLLFDSLNTNPQDLSYARNEMLNFLSKLPPGARVALYALGPRLRMVHSFTENSDELIAAAQQLSAHSHSSYANAKAFSAEIDELKHSGLDKVPGALQKMVRFLGEEYEGKQEWRVQDTFEGFTQLAHALAVVPGRKNLIWISSAFPFDMSSQALQFRKAAALLAANRIAVYPVDARGIAMMGSDAEVTGTEAF